MIIGTEEIPLVDTTAEELRERIELARDRFNRLIRTADPRTQVPRSAWTVQHVVAHVLNVAQRYQSFIETGHFRRAADPRELDLINQAELEAVLAPIPQLAEQLNAIAPIMDEFFDTEMKPDTQNDRVYVFHFNVPVSAVLGATNWLSELLFHGQDIALAMGVPWEMPERDMLLCLRGGLEVAPVYLRSDIPMQTNLCVAYNIPAARPFLLHIHDGTLKTRVRRASDRPDVVIKASASTLMHMLFQRIGPFAALRRGMRVVGGRRPWRVLKLQSCFERP